jgi:hypothetical protein
VGVGLGGLLAFDAAASGTVDHVALWATPARGRGFLRELSAFAAFETARILESGAPAGPPLPPGVLAASGFVLPAETAAELSALDLTERPLPSAARVLLLDRDGVAPDRALVEAAREAGAQVTVAPGRGYAAMLAEPDRAVTPLEPLGVLRSWLAELPAGDRPLPVPAPRPAQELDLGQVRERPFAVASAEGRLVGILSKPVGASRPLAALFLNAGAVRRIGPHRLWVETARRWARRGVASARLDLAGIGDSDGDAAALRDVATFYDDAYTRQVSAALDELERHGVVGPFLVAGLCSGSSWAFQTALRDPRVAVAVMINPRILVWDPRIDVRRDLRRTRLLAKGVTWRRLLRGDVSWSRYRDVGAWAAGTAVDRLLRREAPSPVLGQVVDAFDRLHARGVDLRFVFCDGEPLHDELVRDGLLEGARWPNVSVAAVPGRDHTLRPLWMHEHVDAALDEALEEQLLRVGGAERQHA